MGQLCLPAFPISRGNPDPGWGCCPGCPHGLPLTAAIPSSRPHSTQEHLSRVSLLSFNDFESAYNNNASSSIFHWWALTRSAPKARDRHFYYSQKLASCPLSREPLLFLRGKHFLPTAMDWTVYQCNCVGLSFCKQGGGHLASSGQQAATDVLAEVLLWLSVSIPFGWIPKAPT